MADVRPKLTQQLRSLAVDQGFAQVGIAPAVTQTGFHRLLEWLSHGHAADMQWMERRSEAYRHPDSMLPGTKSVIMLAMNYHDGTERPSGPKVARYAWGNADYHDVLKQRLAPLVSLIRQHSSEARCRVVVDTAPLLERDFGRLAGLGWFGKNTMLISRSIGSWFVLGALLTNLELDYDAPENSTFCGTCTRCLDACPTDAFPEPGVLDARRCISYLTIEQRTHAIPEVLRSAMGDWMFGCDVCQDVCPWNRFAPDATIDEFRALEQRVRVDGRALLRMSPEQFEAEFRNTPLSRPGRAGLLRNVAIVLGNLKDVSAEPDLTAALDDPEPLIRGAAAWALGQLGTATAFPALQKRMAVEQDPTVALELQAAMNQCSNNLAEEDNAGRVESLDWK